MSRNFADDLAEETRKLQESSKMPKLPKLQLSSLYGSMKDSNLKSKLLGDVDVSPNVKVMYDVSDSNDETNNLVIISESMADKLLSKTIMPTVKLSARDLIN